MFLRLLAAFIIIPLVELYLLLRMAAWTGPGATFLLVLVTGIIGSWLAKRESVIAWAKFQQTVAQGRMPSKEIQDGMMILFAGALLLTPGLITDIIGFLLLTPPGRSFVRKFVIQRYLNRMNLKFTATSFDNQQTQDPNRDVDPMTVDAASFQKKPVK